MHSVPTAGSADSRSWMAASISIGLLAWSGGVGAAGKVYVANEEADTVSVRDSASFKVLAIVDVQSSKVTKTVETGAGAHGVVIDREGRFAYVSNTYAGSVSVLDIKDRKVVATVRIGKGPNGISLTP